MDRSDNIIWMAITGPGDNSFTIAVPADPAANTAYFVPLTDGFNGLATVPVADEQFETDNAAFRAQIGKIQFAPRVVVITGQIVTPKITNADTAFTNRVNFLRSIQKILAPMQDGLNLNVKLRNPDTTYRLYCHLHGGEALRVQKYPNHYGVVLTLQAEDPLFYKTATAQTTNVVNNGDIPEYARIELENCTNVTSYRCTDASGSHTTVSFLNAVNGNITILVRYPGQICSISGTAISNIDISAGKPAFIPVPVGSSTWIRTGDNGTVTVYPRSPVIGVSP